MTADLTRRALFRGSAKPIRRAPWTDHTLTDHCTRCGDCISACPEQVLFKGDGGFPEIRFDQEGCSLCGQCAEVCEAPVFDLARPAFPWRASLADHCLAFANIHCQSCQDACETGAIRFQPALGRVPRPRVELDACTGCGACLAVCPADAIELEISDAG